MYKNFDILKQPVISQVMIRFRPNDLSMEIVGVRIKLQLASWFYCENLLIPHPCRKLFSGAECTTVGATEIYSKCVCGSTAAYKTTAYGSKRRTAPNHVDGSTDNTRARMCTVAAEASRVLSNVI